MVNWLKWGLIGAAIAGVVIFRDQIKNALGGAGKSLGEGVGSAGSGFITGAIEGLVKPLSPSSFTYEESRRNLPQGFPGLFDLFGVPQSAYADTGHDPVPAGRDNANDPSITPYNREAVAKLELSASKSQVGFHGQSTNTAVAFIRSGQPVSRAEAQTKSFGEAFRSIPTGGHADRVRQAQAKAGTTITPLALFRIYKAQGMSNTEAMRRAREQFG